MCFSKDDAGRISSCSCTEMQVPDFILKPLIQQKFYSTNHSLCLQIFLWMPWTILYQSCEMIMHPAGIKQNP